VGVVERSDGATRRVPLFGVEADGLGRTLPIGSGRRLSAPDADEALVDRFLAEREGWAAGDRITLYPHPDAPEGKRVEITGILAGASLGRIVVPIGVARGLYGLGDRSTGALLEGAVTREAEDRIAELYGIESVRATAGVVAGVEDSFRGNLALLWAAFGAAVAAALLFLGVLALLEADERAPEVALLEALGWRERSIFSALAAEVGTRCLLAVLLAAALAPLLAAWLRARIAAGSGYVLPTAGTDGPTLLALGGAALATLLAAVPAHLASRRTGPGERLRLLARE
jgi:ABC-type antimicrobial peptide transport system permease subunit